MDKEQQAALIVLIEAAIQRKAEPEDIDPTLTARNIVHALDGLSSHWEAIGEGLDFTEYKIMQIADEFPDNDRRLLEVILHWLNSNKHCTWETIVEVVKKLGKDEYIEFINIHKEELKRIILKSKPKPKLIPHCRQLLLKNDTCYEDWWLDRVEFELDPLQRKVSEKDFKHISAVIGKYVPTEWATIGHDLELSEAEIQITKKDYKDDTREQFQQMIYIWIYSNEKRTWKELVNVLRNSKYNIAAADAMIEAARDAMTEAARKRRMQKHEQKQTGTVLPPPETKVNDQDIEQHRSIKKSTTIKLHKILKVADSVSDDDLVEDLADHIKKASLNQTQLKEVMNVIKRLEKYMKEYSDELGDWASKLKTDMEIVQDIKDKLFDRLQKLNKLQNNLKRKEIYAHIIHKESCSFEKNNTSDRQPQDRSETEKKLERVNKEIKTSLTEIDLANTDYKTISNKLDECQEDLNACVDEFEQFQSAMKKRSEGLWYCLYILVIIIAVIFGTIVGGVTAGITAGAPGIIFGLVAGFIVGFIAGGCIGSHVRSWAGTCSTGGCIRSRVRSWAGMYSEITSRIFHRPEKHEHKECKKFIDSCITQLQDNTRNLQEIQDQLNTAKHPYATA